MLEHVMKELAAYQAINRRPAVDEPANAFEQAVNEWYALQSLQDAVKTAMKRVNEAERTMRDALADSLRKHMKADLKEGVNAYSLSNGRKLKLSHNIDRKIDETGLADSRKFYAENATEGDPAFDALLRVKYELNVAPWRKLSEPA
ncbi:MAG: DUF7173 family protein, partial [Beijerinckiaceae bacterium]